MASLSLASSPLFLILSLSVLLLHSCHAADPDPLQDFCVGLPNATNVYLNGFPCKKSSGVISNDFYYSGLQQAGTPNIFGVSFSIGVAQTFPGLNTLGVSINRITYLRGGTNTPHVHPRATELLYVVRGRVNAAFVTTNNVLYSKDLKAGDLFVFPRGLVHYNYNIGKAGAETLAFFNSQFAGTSVISLNLFASMPSIPDEVLEKSFLVNEQTVEAIKANLAS
ncbi:germin-like protein subfamily 2 member 2 [Tasmannia lanceolata]|uniref:germin-like protein subfamily 2 member 2 n=1 Tax=Tasmannia lanceolata TaxID=3420 RepID=UPI004062B1E5